MATKYFIYSKSQAKHFTEVEASLGKKYYAGTVLVKGKPKRYTQLTGDLSSVQYADYKIIAEGDPDTMNYTKPYSQY